MAITVLKPYVVLFRSSADLIGPHRFPRGAGFRLSRQQVEARLMEWALHAVALNPPFGQSRIAMRTVIRQREKFPVHPEDGDICPFNYAAYRLVFDKVVQRTDEVPPQRHGNTEEPGIPRSVSPRAIRSEKRR